MKTATTEVQKFTSYQIQLLICIAGLLFTMVLDFMLLPAISAMVMPALDLSTSQFGYVVSAYSISAGTSALIFSTFADRFERKKLLMFIYTGFLIGILGSALAQGFWMLIAARVFTGIFGGVVAAICYAMVSEIFSLQQRGRAMGSLHVAFALCQVLGLPAAVFIASHYQWQMAYFIILSVGLLFYILSLFIMKPITGHLKEQSNVSSKLKGIVSTPSYWFVFANNVTLVIADVLFMTFASVFYVKNQLISEDDLAVVFGASGIATILLSPLIGKLADKTSHFKVFAIGTGIAAIMVVTISQLNEAGIIWVVVCNTLLFSGMAARMICSGALGLEIPKSTDRGSFMTFDSALQLICAGVAATAAGWIVFQDEDGKMLNYPVLSIIVVLLMGITLFFTLKISRNATSSATHLQSKESSNNLS
ncbi:arabinose efflux permease family protein [Owenweeksia hongkongensis DSM 17368]|uniref:Arabinose efflux permease family protein n=1 Tax=Owenweeksia hongkongensis (strain DSM 17368 / CIP 108786 / JCM 12287 / NRRL B-23963 / UST20020801) TaxID=926562 RepID=G8R7X8_OWEHD|nr:MFS transporter [Owenweeksia hongkongensis]AEV31301.1 arabinose efflux permease family protein [Owenweeksia hongkongensis DSM 17368]